MSTNKKDSVTQEQATALAAIARQFGLQVAALCDDPDGIDHLVQKYLTTLGPQGFGPMAAIALRLIAVEILNPIITDDEAAGSKIRATLRALAEGRAVK